MFHLPPLSLHFFRVQNPLPFHNVKRLQCCGRAVEGTVDIATAVAQALWVPHGCGLQAGSCGAPLPGLQVLDGVLGRSLQPQTSGPPFARQLLVTNKLSLLQTSSAQGPGRRGEAPRSGPLDVDEGPLVAVGRLGLHAAPLPPCDPAVPVELGIAAQPWAKSGQGGEGCALDQSSPHFLPYTPSGTPAPSHHHPLLYSALQPTPYPPHSSSLNAEEERGE